MFAPFAENPQPKWYIGEKHINFSIHNKNPVHPNGIFLFSLPEIKMARFFMMDEELTSLTKKPSLQTAEGIYLKSNKSFGLISRTSHNLNMTSKETPTFPNSIALM